MSEIVRMSCEEILEEFKLMGINSNPWSSTYFSLPTLPVNLELGDKKYTFKALLSREAKDSFISIRAAIALGIKSQLPYAPNVDITSKEASSYFSEMTKMKDNVILSSRHDPMTIKLEKSESPSSSPSSPTKYDSLNKNEKETKEFYIKACQVKIEVITVPYINVYEPSINWNDYVNLWKHSEITPIFESNNCCFFQDGKIDVVIGIEGLCLSGPLRTIPPGYVNFPTAEETRLGWVAHGPVPAEIAYPDYVPQYPTSYNQMS